MYTPSTSNLVGHLKILPITVCLLVPKVLCPSQMQKTFTFSQASQESHHITVLTPKSKSHHLNYLNQMWVILDMIHPGAEFFSGTFVKLENKAPASIILWWKTFEIGIPISKERYWK